MREALNAKNMTAIQLDGAVDRGSELPDGVIEWLFADGAEAGAVGDGFDFDVWGRQEEVEVSSGLLDVGYCEW